MDVCFRQDDLEKWARFSGDYNPIHFDEQVAVSGFGLDGVVVHGMLAMMPLKACVSRADWGAGGWVRWWAILKRAIPLKSGFAISMDALSPNEKARFSLSESGKGTKNIIGGCSMSEFDAAEFPSTPRHFVERKRLQDKFKEFRQNFPKVDGLWVYLDALIFSEYIINHSLTMFQEEMLEHYGLDIRNKDPLQELMVMHTNHALTATVSIVGRPLREAPRVVGYDIVKKDRIITKDAVFALIAIPVWIDDQMEMVIEMGLMAKKRL